MGQGHPCRLTQKRDRSILCIVQISMKHFFDRKCDLVTANDFCISLLIRPHFELSMHSNALCMCT